MNLEAAERFVGLIGVPTATLGILLYMTYRFIKAVTPHIKEIIDKRTEILASQAVAITKQTEIMQVLGNPNGNFSNIKTHKVLEELSNAILQITPEKKKTEVGECVRRIKEIMNKE